MSGRLKDYLAWGMIADIPDPADLVADPAIQAGVGAIFFAIDEAKAYALDPDAIAWVPLEPTAPTATAAFGATKGGTAQTGIVSGTPTLVTLDTEEFDVGGFYDTGASRWTPPAGIASITMGLAASGIDAGEQWGLIAAKNGTFIKMVAPPSPATYGALSLAIVDQCNGSDYYEMFAYGITSGTITFSGDTKYTFFQGVVI